MGRPCFGPTGVAVIHAGSLDAFWATLGPWDRFAMALGATLAAAWLAGRLARVLVRRGGRVLRRRPGPALERGARLAATAAVAAVGIIGALRNLPLDDAALHVLGNLVRTALVLVLALAALHLATEAVERVVGRVAERTERVAELRPLLANLVHLGVVAIALIALLGVWGVAVAPLIASAGLVGAVVALAAKETLGNVFGGISLILDRSYKVGDYLVLPSGERGRVVEIGIRSTQLVTPDEVLITVPNAIMATDMVVNQSAPYASFRVRLPVGVAYDADLERVRRVLLRIAAEHPLVPDSPEPRVWLVAFGDSAVALELLVWCPDPARLNGMISDLNFGIHRAFRAEGIEIPYPQRVVHTAGGTDEAPRAG